MIARAALSTVAAMLAVAPPAAAQSYDEAVRANMMLGIDLCLRWLPDVENTNMALTRAGFEHRIEVIGPGDRIHWHRAPVDTAVVSVSGGPPRPTECRVTTTHMGAGAAVPFAGAVLQQLYPGQFTYGTIDGSNPVSAGDAQGSTQYCTGYHGLLAGQPIYIMIANSGVRLTCVEDGTAQVIIRR